MKTWSETMKIAPAALFLAVCATAFAQRYEEFHGRITGTSGDRGKCTIDIVVDGVVEVEVSGSDGRMRALSGAAPQWRRLQCNMPMPANPGEFRFSPQEGRGKQTMLREPGQNRGVALVRIEDPDGGSEGYKFDLEWRGTGSFNSGGFGNGGGFGNNGGGFGGNNNGNSGNGGSIFGNGNNGNGNNGNPGPIPGWNRQLDYNGRGDGYYRSFRGSDAQLSDGSVHIDRNGRVDVQLTTNQRDRITLSGRLISVDRDRLVAEMSGSNMRGNMDIRVDNKNRVQEITMSGSGRDRFDLRWNRR
jgi:hypothetical protein